MKYRIKPHGDYAWKLQVKIGWFTWKDTGAIDSSFFEIVKLKTALERK